MMKKLIIIAAVTWISFSLAGQDNMEVVMDVPSENTHWIKVGASLQYDFGRFHYYDYDYSFPYQSYNHNTSFSDYEGPNTQVFVAYEHIWPIANQMGIGIEPKLGIIFRDNTARGGFLGANWKYYWINTDFWRMGIYLFTSYEYNSSERQMLISKEGGMYSELMDLNINQNVFSFDISLTAFQFTLKSIPMMFECNITALGLHVFYTSSKKHDIGNGETYKFKQNRAGPYGPKIEFKVGWKIK